MYPAGVERSDRLYMGLGTYLWTYCGWEGQLWNTGRARPELEIWFFSIVDSIYLSDAFHFLGHWFLTTCGEQQALIHFSSSSIWSTISGQNMVRLPSPEPGHIQLKDTSPLIIILNLVLMFSWENHLLTMNFIISSYSTEHRQRPTGQSRSWQRDRL